MGDLKYSLLSEDEKNVNSAEAHRNTYRAFDEVIEKLNEIEKRVAELDIKFDIILKLLKDNE